MSIDKVEHLRMIATKHMPDEIKISPFMCLSERRYVNGWNDCRAEMLKGDK